MQILGTCIIPTLPPGHFPNFPPGHVRADIRTSRNVRPGQGGHVRADIFWCPDVRADMSGPGNSGNPILTPPPPDMSGKDLNSLIFGPENSLKIFEIWVPKFFCT